jgi:hypothetical protein
MQKSVLIGNVNQERGLSTYFTITSRRIVDTGTYMNINLVMKCNVCGRLVSENYATKPVSLDVSLFHA